MRTSKTGRRPQRFFTIFLASMAYALLTPVCVLGEELRIEIMDVHTGHHYTLDPKSPYTQQGSPSFSPDQKTVVYDATRDGENFQSSRVLLTKADGSQEEPTDLCSGAMPSFSKDGKRIAFSSPTKRGVWVMDVDGENQQQVAKDNNPWAIVFSPQDNDIVAYTVYTNDGNNIQIHNLKTDKKHLLLPEDVADTYRQIIWNFQWSPDASKIAFTARTAVTGGTGDCVVATIDTDRENPKHEVLTVEEAHCRVAIHPVTNEVFYSTRMPSKAVRRIFSLNPTAPKEFRTPVYLATQPDERGNLIGSFSKDGNLIMFSSVEAKTVSAIDAKSFQKKVRPGLGAVAKLKLARSHLQKSEYDAFVDEVMSELDDDEKKAGREHVEENVNQWLGTINEAISQMDQAKITDSSVVIPLEQRGFELKLIQDRGEWILETDQSPEF